MKISVITRKNNLPKLRKLAKRINKAKAEYGYFQEQGVHSSGLTYATLMAIHEHGTRNGNIPARMPFSIALFANKSKILKTTLKQLNKCVRSTASGNILPLETALSTFGSMGVYSTKQVFGSSALTPNKDPIRKRSGSESNTPLIDFGELRDNMAYRTSENKEIKT